MPNTSGEALKFTGLGGLPTFPVSVVSGALVHTLDISDAFIARTLT